jgi:hypothetical protein
MLSVDHYVTQLSHAWFTRPRHDEEEEKPKHTPDPPPGGHREPVPDKEHHDPKHDPKHEPKPDPGPQPPGPPDVQKVVPLGPDGKPLQQ